MKQWNFWRKKIDTGFARPNYADNLYKQKDIKEVSVVIGARRSGKSTILLQTLKRIIDDGVPPANVLYINFEEPAFARDLSLKFLLQIYDAFREAFAPKGKTYIALDEISLVPEWEKFVRGLYDRGEDIKFYVTDSSSRLLSGEFGRVLTGRTYSNVVYPLNFAEFIHFKGMGKRSLKDEAHSPELRNLFLEFLRYGGFPQVVLTKNEDDKIKILKEYYTAIIEKDIVQRYQVRNFGQLKEFCLLAMTNNGLPTSGYNIEKKQKISQPTANKFFDYLSEVFLMFSVDYFSFSLTQRQTRPKKFYSIDTGIYNAVSFKFSENIGRIFENIVFLDLLRAGLEVFYWADKQETDFVVRRGVIVERLINVCWNLNNENRARELAGLDEAMQKFKIKKAELITLGFEERVEVTSGTVKIKNYFLRLPFSPHL